MKYLNQIIKLANRFEKKLVIAQDISTKFGDAEGLFFEGSRQKEFESAAGTVAMEGNKIVGTGPVGNVLAAYWNKTNKPCSFAMKVNIASGKGANYEIVASPPALKPALTQAVKSLYNKMFGKDLDKVALEATAFVRSNPQGAQDDSKYVVNSIELA